MPGGRKWRCGSCDCGGPVTFVGHLPDVGPDCGSLQRGHIAIAQKMDRRSKLVTCKGSASAPARALPKISVPRHIFQVTAEMCHKLK